MTAVKPPPDGAGRAEFEAWYRSTFMPGERRPSDLAWDAWQAALRVARSHPAPPAAEPVATYDFLLRLRNFVHDYGAGSPGEARALSARLDQLLRLAPLYTHPAPAGPGKEGG